MADNISDLEKEAGIVARDPKHVAKLKTTDELIADYSEHPEQYIGLNYDDRVEFLESNGYKVTRRNLLNSDLSAKQPKKNSRGRSAA